MIGDEGSHASFGSYGFTLFDTVRMICKVGILLRGGRIQLCSIPAKILSLSVHKKHIFGATHIFIEDYRLFEQSLFTRQSVV